MKMNVKRTLSILVIAVMVLTLVSPLTFAKGTAVAESATIDEETVIDQKITLAEQEYIEDYLGSGYDKDFAVEFSLAVMRESQNNPDVQVGQIAPMYDIYDNVTAYDISFVCDGRDVGYIIFSNLEKEDPITEFSLEGTSNYSRILDEEYINANLPSSITVPDTPKLIYLGTDQLYVADADNNDSTVLDVITGKMVGGSELIENYEIQVDQIITETTEDSDMQLLSFDYSTIIDWGKASLDTSSVFKIKDFGVGTDYWLMTNFSSGLVCAPTAATNVMWYWAKSRSVTKLYNSYKGATYLKTATNIYNHAKFVMTTSSDYGTFTFAMKAYYSAANDRKNLFGYKFNYKILDYGSSYSTFQAAFKDDCPVHVQLRKSLTDMNGHDVMGIGYANSTGGTKYIFCMDGWNTYGRFVKFSSFAKIGGVKVWASN